MVATTEWFTIGLEMPRKWLLSPRWRVPAPGMGARKPVLSLWLGLQASRGWWGAQQPEAGRAWLEHAGRLGGAVLDAQWPAHHWGTSSGSGSQWHRADAGGARPRWEWAMLQVGGGKWLYICFLLDGFGTPRPGLGGKWDWAA